MWLTAGKQASDTRFFVKPVNPVVKPLEPSSPLSLPILKNINPQLGVLKACEEYSKNICMDSSWGASEWRVGSWGSIYLDSSGWRVGCSSLKDAFGDRAQCQLEFTPCCESPCSCDLFSDVGFNACINKLTYKTRAGREE